MTPQQSGGRGVVKPEWGLKRTCPSCGARFYDMARLPILCPKCGAAVGTEVTFKTSRRSAAAAEPKVAPLAAVAAAAVAAGEAEDIDILDDSGEEADVDVLDEDEEDGDDLIEDTSDLGGDDEDMAEVIDHLDEMEDEL
ncbi:MAG: TIGR02300 family protein [Rhodospirillaceae bacterium]|nr:TIGR02300 family protein [Rhodospirillaceae bacterium]